MHWLMELQRWLYGGMLGSMKSSVDLAGLPALMGAAFVFGIAHALMPGHGKSILVSYHLSRPGRLTEGVATGTLLALTHVGLAVVLVSIDFCFESSALGRIKKRHCVGSRWSTLAMDLERGCQTNTETSAGAADSRHPRGSDEIAVARVDVELRRRFLVGLHRRLAPRLSRHRRASSRRSSGAEARRD